MSKTGAPKMQIPLRKLRSNSGEKVNCYILLLTGNQGCDLYYTVPFFFSLNDQR